MRIIFYSIENIIRIGILIITIILSNSYLTQINRYWATNKWSTLNSSRLNGTEDLYILTNEEIHINLLESISKGNKTELEYKMEEIRENLGCAVLEGEAIRLQTNNSIRWVKGGIGMSIILICLLLILDILNTRFRVEYIEYIYKELMNSGVIRSLIADGIDSLSLLCCLPIYTYIYNTQCIQVLHDIPTNNIHQETRNPCAFLYTLFQGLYIFWRICISFSIYIIYCTKYYASTTQPGNEVHPCDQGGG